MPVVDDYTALLSGGYWNGIEVTGRPVIVTYSFSTSLPAYAASIDGFTPETLASFTEFTPAEQNQATTALGEWAAASGLVFIQVAPGEGDINFQNVDLDTTSYAGAGGIGFYPFGEWDNFSYPSFSDDLDASGDIFMNTQFLSGGTVAYGTLLHEIGHAIGLRHPMEPTTNFAAEPPVVHDETLASDDPTLTIMASVGDGSNPDPHLLTLDKNAAAFIYGAAGTGGVVTTSTSGSNAVSNWSWNAATETLTQTAATTAATIRGSSVSDIIHGSDGDDRLFGLAGNDTLDAGKGNDSLFGGSGTDTLIGGVGDDAYHIMSSASTIVENSDEGDDIVYATVSFTLPDNVETLQVFGVGLTAQGNNQNVVLYGDGTNATTLIGGTGSDELNAFAGNDVLVGGGGIDLMFGGDGADRFVFKALGDAPVGEFKTAIGDFIDDQDKIDLSAITTVGGPSPGQPLNFIGASAFSKTAGEVHQTVLAADTMVEGDVDGDGAADLQIVLYNAHSLKTADFIFEALPCYRAGTQIRTVHGDMPVEHLSIGTQVATAAGTARPITWIGHRRLDCRRHPDPRQLWPVRVRAGAFGDNLPQRDLFLSPDHAVFVDAVLIPIRHLINGATIAQVATDAVTYYHVELQRHDVLLAEGLPAESYLNTGNRGAFANGGGPVELHPSFGPVKTWRDDAVAPLVNDEACVRPVWQRLADRARAMGQPIPEIAFTDDPAVHLRVDGRVIRPVLSRRDDCSFIVPTGARDIRLVSRSGYPTDARPWVDDRRRLGVYVSRIVWHGTDGPCEVPLDHPGLGSGWWHVERSGGALVRWTDGDAALAQPNDATMLEVHLASGIQYRLDRPDPGPVRAAA